MEETKKKQSGVGIASLVVGIISLLLSCIGYGAILGVVGLILAIIGLCKKDHGKGMAIAGLVLSLIAIVVGGIILITAATIVNSAETKSDEIANLTENQTDEISTDDRESEAQVETDDAEDSNEEETAKDEDVKAQYEVGDVVETDAFKISFTDAEEYISDNQFIQPEDGNVYYRMTFEFENISDSDQYVSSINFSCYADGYDCEQAYLDNLDLDATLSAGKKTKGSVFFEVPNDCEEVILEYEVNLWTEEKLEFKVK